MNELDTMPLIDGRHTVGPWTHRTGEEMEAGWRLWIEGGERDGIAARPNGLPVRQRAGDFSTELRTSRKTIVAGVEAGRWTSRCPDCNDGIRVWPQHPRGCCLGCGTIFRVDWPTVEEIREAVELLAVRPLEQRNWHRFNAEHETVEFLRSENAVYQFAAPDQGSVRVADLREILSKRAFAQLEQAGVV